MIEEFSVAQSLRCNNYNYVVLFALIHVCISGIGYQYHMIESTYCGCNLHNYYYVRGIYMYPNMLCFKLKENCGIFCCMTP